MICFWGESFAQTRITIDYNNTPGTSSLPYCYLQNVTAELWSGGGGGGGAHSKYGATAAGGGGGGAYANGTLNAAVSSNITIIVGYGGSKGIGNQGGANGGESSISSGSNYIKALGGGGGFSAYRDGGGLTTGGGGGKGTVSSSGNVTITTSTNGNDGNGGAGGITAPSAGKGGNSASSASGGNGGSRSGTAGKSNGSNGSALGGGGGGGAAYSLSSLVQQYADGGDGAVGNVNISFDFAIPNIAINKSASNFCDGGNDVISINSTVCSGSTYQWYKDGIAISGATSSSLTVTETGTYYCVVTLTISDLKTTLGVPNTASVTPNSATASKQSGNCVVTIKQATSSTIDAAICAGESYILNGQTYTTAGTYTQHLTNAQGCDSAITLYTTVYPAPEVEFLTTAACAEDEQIVLSFTGQPPFTMNYTLDADCVGSQLNPNAYGFPTIFGDGYPNIVSWINNGSNYLAGILPYLTGGLHFHILEIIDNIGCRSVRPE
ncbi:hypothetical protein FACS1894178_2990 [Bacteroidia bacterium]|nr:hypothetical protein FACS1894178_2990 [Bacteroidia bacterium]